MLPPVLPPLPRDRDEARRYFLAADAEICRRSYRAFAERAWPLAEPATPFIANWHVDAVCEHYEALIRGQIRKLIVNIPPGCAKSLLGPSLLPAWTWTIRPEWRGLFGSYSEALSIRDSVRTRTVVESPWYQERFCLDPLRGFKRAWGLKSDQNAKDFFENTLSGFRIALTVAGKGTGYRGNLVCVDDALNVFDAKSKAKKEAGIFWWDQQMSNRVNDPAKDAFLIIGQRLAVDDLPGHCLEQGGYVLLCLPSEFDPKRICVTPLGTVDKRTEPEELLFPQIYGPAAIADAKTVLGSEGYAGQHDQLPMPAGGGMFKRAWWRFWRWDKDQPTTTARPEGCNGLPTRELMAAGWKWDSVVMSVDATFKSAEQSASGSPDRVAIHVWGCKDADRFLLYRWKKTAGFGETCQAIRDASKLFPTCYRKLIEAKANGPAIVETLQHEISGIIAVEPEGGKESRANAVAPQIEAGNVYLPEGAGWLDDFIGEHAAFPKGKHDDDVDATSQALIDRMQGRGNRLKMLVGG